MSDLDEFKEYVVHYNYGNSQWGVVIKARDFADAERRLYAIGHGTIGGELVATIPAGMGLFVRLAVWLRNLVRP